MNLLVLSILMVGVAVGLLGPFSSWIARSTWVNRAPRSAVLLWQCTGLGAIVAALCAGLSLAGYRYHVGFLGGVESLGKSLFSRHPLQGLGLYNALALTLVADLVIVLVAVFAVVTVRTIKLRGRHRRILDLVAEKSQAYPGTRLLADNRAVAYCLPGLRPRIVVSDGALRLLGESQLKAVIEHERGHAHERHDLVMLVMTGLKKLFPWIPYARLAPVAVGVLLEMAADDFSTRRNDRRELAAALVEMATAGLVPCCALAASRLAVSARVERLTSDAPTSRTVALATGALAALVVALPICLPLTG